MKKRIVALLVCFILLLGVLPLGVFAGGTISTVSINGFVSPMLGVTAGELTGLAKVSSGAPYYIEEDSECWAWYDAGTNYLLANDDVFEAGKTYVHSWTICAKEGYTFDSNLTVNINGSTALVDATYTRIANTERTRLYVWTVTQEPTTDMSIRVTGYHAPEVGETADENLASISIPSDAPYTLSELYWYDYTADKVMGDDDVFVADNVYYIHFKAMPKTGYTFGDACPPVYINGGTEYVDKDWTDLYGGNVVFYTVDVEPLRVITRVDLYGYASPILGVTAGGLTGLAEVPSGNPYYIGVSSEYWYCDSTNHQMASTEVFEEGKTYSYKWTIYANEGYVFDDALTVTINGKTELVDTHYTSIANEAQTKLYVWTVTKAPTEEMTINVTGYRTPTAGETADDNLATVQIPSNAPYTIDVLYWYNSTANRKMSGSDVFVEGNEYFLHFEVVPKEGYSFADVWPPVFINGNTFLVDKQWTSFSDSKVEFYTLDVRPFAAITGAVEVSGFVVPKPGETAGGNLALLKLPDDALYTFSKLYWYDSTNGHEMSDDEVFAAGNKYFIRFEVKPMVGYSFGSTCPTVYINGGTTYVDTDWMQFTANGVVFYTVDLVLSSVTYGDVNGDGAVNKKDSLALKKYLADNTNPCDLAAADVTGDGVVNKKDSLRLKQYLAGWSVTLGA